MRAVECPEFKFAFDGLATTMPLNDLDFPLYIAERLATLPTVEAVALGGSRAAGTHRPDSDWDFAVYYRGPFDPADLRALGWPGEISEIGGWGGGVFNGGGWLEADGRAIDVHYRDLADVEHHLAEARAGRFRIENLLFYLAGVPTYILVAELAGNRVLTGSLPHPDYPPALREQAPHVWWSRAQLTLGYARSAYAKRGQALDCAGAAARASCETAHAILAARGEWVTNEKRLLDQAGLRAIDTLVATMTPDPTALTVALDTLTATLRTAVADPSGTNSQLALLDRLNAPSTLRSAAAHPADHGEVDPIRSPYGTTSP